MEFIKYKMRVEFVKDSELFLYAIAYFVDEWLVEPLYLKEGQSRLTTRHPWPDKEVTFTASDEITLPMMRWILSTLADLHVAAETLERYEDYTGDRVHFDEVIVEEPSPMVWHVIQHSMEQALDFWTNRVGEIAAAASDLAVPDSIKTNKRLRSKDWAVDSILKDVFNKTRQAV